MVGKNDMGMIQRARKDAGKKRWEAISRSIPPFYEVRGQVERYRGPVPSLSLLRWGIFAIVVAGVVLYIIAS